MRKQFDQGNRPDGFTGELMLAKMMIEERDELLGCKESAIQDLSFRLQDSAERTSELTRSLERATKREEVIRAEERAAVTRAIITEIVEVAARHEDETEAVASVLTSKIFSLLREKYNLHLIEERPQRIDPKLHNVVAVARGVGDKGSIEILSKGYRLGDAVIRPANVRVTLGVSASEGSTTWSGQMGEATARIGDQRYEPS